MLNIFYEVIPYLSFANCIMLIPCIGYSVENIQKSRFAFRAVLVYFSLFIWCFSLTFFYQSTSRADAEFWYRLASIGWILLPAVTLDFLTDLRSHEVKRNMSYHIAVYSLPVAFLLLVFIFRNPVLYTELEFARVHHTWIVHSSFTNIYSYVYLAYFVSFMVFGCIFVIKWKNDSRYSSDRKKALYLLAAAYLVFTIAIATDWFGPLFGTPFPPIANLFFILIAFGSYIVIYRFRLFQSPREITARTILNSMDEAVVFLNQDFKITKINRAATLILGYSLEEVYMQHVDVLTSQEIPGHIKTELEQYSYVLNQDAVLRKKDKTLIHTVLSVAAVENDYQEFLGYIITFKDITEMKKIEEQLIQSNHNHEILLEELFLLANCDLLTGLYNRRFFYNELKTILESPIQEQQQFSLIYMDLNGFKQVNDRHGHKMGDQVLVRTSEILKTCLLEGEELFRMGGDEFVLLMKGPVSQEYLLHKKAAVKKAFAAPLFVEDYYFNLSIAAGTAGYLECESNAELTVKTADQRMYRDKKKMKATQQSACSEGGN